MESKANSGTNKLFYVIIAVLAVAIIFLFWERTKLTQTKDKMVEELLISNKQKDSVKTEFSNLLTEYNDLETSNDTLNARLEVEREKIKTIIAEMDKMKAYSAREIHKYKEELTTLRSIMRGYVVQVDSLNTLNQELIAENKEVRRQYREVVSESEELTEKNKNLTDKVEMASELRARGITAVPLNSKNIATTRVEKFTQVKVCFTIDENSVVEPGIKTVYLRVAGPDGMILFEYESNTFAFNGKELIYSAKKRVEYNNEDLSTCVYWGDYKYEMKSGKYTIDIFIDNNELGTATFVLK